MDGVLLSAIVDGIKTLKDGSVSITVSTNELSPARAAQVFELRNKLTACYFSPKESITQKELDQVDNLTPELQGKTPSQRLRGVLYRVWEQDNDGYKDFEGFYRFKMEKIIDHYKNELNQ